MVDNEDKTSKEWNPNKSKDSKPQFYYWSKVNYNDNDHYIYRDINLIEQETK